MLNLELEFKRYGYEYFLEVFDMYCGLINPNTRGFPAKAKF